MPTLSFRRTPEDPEPALVVDGEPAAPDATITIRAGDLAEFIYQLVGATAAATTIVTAMGMDTAARAMGPASSVGVMAYPPRRKEIERDAAGRIVAIVDVP